MSENKYIDNFLEHLKDRKYAEKTILSYKYPLIDFFSFLAAGSGSDEPPDPAEITLDTLENYKLHIIERGFEASSVYSYIRFIKNFFAYLAEYGMIFENPAEKLENSTPLKKLPEVPSQEEIHALFSAVDVSTVTGIRDRAMLETAYSCALRVAELTSLTVKAADLESGLLRVTGKGGKERTVPLGEHAVMWIENYLRNSRPHLAAFSSFKALWLSSKGYKIQSHFAGIMIRKYSYLAGCENITVHSLRRACATHMLQNGAHPVQVQMLLGHASLKTLGRYLRLSVNDLKKTHSRTNPGK